MTGQAQVTPAELVHQLATKMRAANLDSENSRAWTEALKDCIQDLRETKGTNITEVLYSHRENGKHEFLLDVVVWDRSNCEGVKLAVEANGHRM